MSHAESQPSRQCAVKGGGQGHPEGVVLTGSVNLDTSLRGADEPAFRDAPYPSASSTTELPFRQLGRWENNRNVVSREIDRRVILGVALPEE
jgi:hypothetical protein